MPRRTATGYDLCMRTTTRVTITVPDAVLEAARRDVASGAAPSVSAWVTDAAAAKARRESLDHVLDELLEAAGGPLSEDEMAWARAQLRTP
jgi:antitoxin ParD1/3/4